MRGTHTPHSCPMGWSGSCRRLCRGDTHSGPGAGAAGTGRAPSRGTWHGTAGVWVPPGRGWRGGRLGLGAPKGLWENGVSPAVPGVAPAEGDVLHLEEVAAALKLEEKSHPRCGHPAHSRAGTRPLPPAPLTSSSRLYSVTVRMSLMPCSVISRSQLAGGRRCTVSFLVVAIWGHGGGWWA